jgi:protein transport protein HofC
MFSIAHLMLIVLASALVCWICALTFWLVGPVALVLVFFGAVMCCVAAVVVVIRSVSTHRDAVVRALAIAANRGMPLAPALEAFSEQSGFFFRHRARVLADALRSGLPLPAALDRVPGVLPRDAEMMARVGWSAGIPGAALAEAASRRHTPPPWLNVAARFNYLLFVLLTLQSLTAFVLYFIAPKLQAIYRDFGLALPPTTLAVFQMNNVAVREGYIVGLLLAGEVLLVIAIPLIAAGSLAGWLPVFGRLFARKHAAIILRSLAIAVENDKPLAPVLALLARCYPSPWVRDRLRGVALDLNRGRDWCESLRGHGIIGPTEAVLLDAARRAGNLPWALREAADSGERRLTYRLHALVQVLYPILIIALAILVVVVASAYLSPLVRLIERLAG